MPTFGQDFLQGFTQVNNLRDYTHASKTFTTNSWELKPRFKFLFHVVFTLNVDEIPGLRNAKIFQASELYNISLAVKTVDLPKYTISTETLNQYNRKRVIQTKINYDPVTITFHDDGGDNVREMWYQYYSYYYKDPAQKYVPNAPVTNGSIGATAPGFSYNTRDIYDTGRSGNINDWGFIGESFLDGTSSQQSLNSTGKPPFFKDIQIYGFDQHKYARYILVNPIISAFGHDRYDYSEGAGIMENTMTINYETVKYLNGALGNPDKNVAWPDNAHYDTTTSSLSRPGSTTSVFGQGGLLSTGEGILADLQSGSVMGLIGAAQKAGTLKNTWKGKDIKSVVKSEALSLGKQTISQMGPNATKQVINKVDGWVFPTAPRNTKQNTSTSTNVNLNIGP